LQLTRLRLSGFKSFVEHTELAIEPGLTGIVGPNGCGKSNLVEALRWVMGESSYKAMRASGMDDVIFSGSGNRPARNSAEVTLVLDNSGTNDFSGPVAINAGTVQIGNGDASGNFGPGPITDNGALVFTRNDNITLSNPLSGVGTLSQSGIGVLTLAGGNANFVGGEQGVLIDRSISPRS